MKKKVETIKGGISVDDFVQRSNAQRELSNSERLSAVAKERDAWKYKCQQISTQFDQLQSEFDLITHTSIDSAIPVDIVPKMKGSKEEVCAMAFLTDIHPFEVIKSEEINGLNEFNPEICSESLNKFFRKIVSYTEIHRSVATVKTLVLGMLGDLIGNMIHADQKETNAGTPIEEVLFIYEHLVGGLNFLLEHGKFDEIILCGVSGNHDRNTEKLQYSHATQHSYAWLIYKLLEKHFAGVKKIRFNIPTSYLLYQKVYGMNFRMFHGDSIKFKGGIGGLSVPANRVIRQYDSAIRADWSVFGHAHTDLRGERFNSVGSIVGYNPMAAKMGFPYEPASQVYLLVDKSSSRIVCEQKIFVR